MIFYGEKGCESKLKNLIGRPLEERTEGSNNNLTTGVGTPVYCSPEQLKEGKRYDQKVCGHSVHRIQSF